MWSSAVAILAAASLSVADAAPAPAAPALTAAEMAHLDRGEVVIRPPPSVHEQAVGIVDIAATPEQVWSVILDFPARVASVSVLKSIEVYAPESDPEGLGATFHLRVLGSDVIYHLRYDIDRAQNYCTFTLDPERTHDIVTASGSYQVFALPDGKQRLVYRSQTDTGRYVPGFVQKMLTNESLRSQLEEMQRRAPTK